MTTQNESAVLDISLPAPPSFRLDGKRALVTGAGRGIGLAGAAAMAKAGAHVTLVARSSAEIESLARAIERDGGQAEAAPLDVTDIGRVERVLSSLEPFDILVNSAGTNHPAPFLDVTAEQYDTIMGLNVRSLFFVSQVVARRMREAGRPGSIIQHLLADGTCGRRDPHRLLRLEMGHRGHDESDGGRPRAVRHSGQHNRPDLHRDAAVDSLPQR